MHKDERDLLEVLKFELEFLEKGGYGRSPRAPWRPQFIFEDSPTCMNYDSKEHPDPCGDCILMKLVPPEGWTKDIPCRHIPLTWRRHAGFSLQDRRPARDRRHVRKLAARNNQATGRRACGDALGKPQAACSSGSRISGHPST